MSIAAYHRTQRHAFDPRTEELRALARVTRGLSQAGEEDWRGARLVGALHDNRMLWQSFADDCAMPTNGLREETRASIIGLALWVHRHSSDVARGREAVGDLVRLNQTIMEGLAATPVEASEPEPALAR